MSHEPPTSATYSHHQPSGIPLTAHAHTIPGAPSHSPPLPNTTVVNNPDAPCQPVPPDGLPHPSQTDEGQAKVFYFPLPVDTKNTPACLLIFLLKTRIWILAQTLLRVHGNKRQFASP